MISPKHYKTYTYEYYYRNSCQLSRFMVLKCKDLWFNVLQWQFLNFLVLWWTPNINWKLAPVLLVCERPLIVDIHTYFKIFFANFLIALLSSKLQCSNLSITYNSNTQSLKKNIFRNPDFLLPLRCLPFIRVVVVINKHCPNKIDPLIHTYQLILQLYHIIQKLDMCT